MTSEQTTKPQAILANRLYVPAAYVEPKHLVQFEYQWDDPNQDPDESSEGLVRTYKTMDDGRYIGFNRGDIQKISEVFGDDFDIVDKRSAPVLDFDLRMNDQFQYRPEQGEALQKLTDPNLGGIIKAPPAFGKTVVACCYMAMQGLRAIFLADQTNLCGQFRDEFERFTNIKELEAQHGRQLFGELDNSQETPFPISYSTYQYIYHYPDLLKRIQNYYGVTIGDEIHIAAAKTFCGVFTFLNPLFRVGVSATPTRKDGLHVIFDDVVGPIRFEAKRRSATRCYIVNTGIPVRKQMTNFTRIVSTLAQNEKRNDLIASDTKSRILEGHKAIVLVGLKAHAYQLAEIMRTKWQIKATGLTGNDSADRQNEVKRQVQSGELDCVVATHHLFGKGFNLPVLSFAAIVIPTSNKENFEQWVGRVEREVEGKLDPVVHYYADSGPGLLYGCKNTVKKTCSTLNIPVEEIHKYKPEVEAEDVDSVDRMGIFRLMRTNKSDGDE